MNLQKVLKDHKLWIESGTLRGERADLIRAYLRGADLTRANLRGADLTGANLTRANLHEANLTWANLRGADLHEANLTWANLRGADLTGANLTWADLTGANLTWADLRGADLTRANLTRANLHEADLTGANLDLSSGIPFHCGGVRYLGDDRLLAQMLYHLTRGNWIKASGGAKEAIEHIRSMAISDLFCEYRDDVKPL
jgi:hypothetical protein